MKLKNTNSKLNHPFALYLFFDLWHSFFICALTFVIHLSFELSHLAGVFRGSPALGRGRTI